MNLSEEKERALSAIRRLESRRRRSWAVLALFAIVSILFVLQSMLLPRFPREVRAFLGAPPPIWLINLGLILYAFSALVLTLGRFIREEESFHGWSHLAYLSAFYFFYYYAGEEGMPFWGVFTAGLTILVLEDYRISIRTQEGVKREREILARLERGFHPPARGG